MPVFLQAQSINFSYATEDNLYCTPAGVKFTQSSTGHPVGYLWDFGNGAHSNSANPRYIYTMAGTYTVRLVTVYANTAVEMSRTITIHSSVNTSFTVDRDNICQPGIVNFNVSSSGPVTDYQWDFGDGTVPVNSNAATISHNYTTYGEFTVTLTCTNANGCSSGFSRSVIIKQPVVTASIDRISGCIPVNAGFSANVDVANGSAVSSYQWNFGDGTSATTSVNQVSHTYNSVGTFLPNLTITTTDGCSATYAYDSVAYGIPPTNHMAYSMDTVVCGSEIPVFVSKATNATSYEWVFDDGNPVIVFDTITEHRFTQLGIRDITVTPMHNGCSGTPIDLQIKVIGVIAKYNYKNTCNNRKKFEVRNTSQGNMSSILWNMGDGNTSNTAGNFFHTYPPTGAFPLRLFITDNTTGCVDSLTNIIYTANPSLINPDQSICINTNTNYSLLNNYTNPAAQYTWNVVGLEIGPDSNSSLNVNAIHLGHFNNDYAIIDNGTSYCPDTISLNHPVTVKGPRLDFTAPENLCVNNPLEVINLSQPFQSGDSVNLWIWNFGKVLTNDTIYQPSPYIYYSPRTYIVKLTAIDINGCMDTLVKNVRVRPTPFLWIIPKLDTVCLGQSSTLIGYTSDEILWSSTNNTGFCVTCDTTVVNPLITSRYFARAMNVFGCTALDSAMVKVFTPFTVSTMPHDTSICAGQKLTLDVGPKTGKVIWSPDRYLSGNTLYNPVVAPKISTVYTATLTDSAGCFSSSADVRINVNQNPSVNAGQDKLYTYNTRFSLNPTYSSNVISWLWSPSDSLSCSDCVSPKGTATHSQTYTVTVISDSGCIAKDAVSISVNANMLMPNAFTPNNDQLNDLYRPIGRGIKFIKSFTIYNREGQLIYQARDFSPNESGTGWNGKYKGHDASPTAYMYIVEAVSELGDIVMSKGSFLLIR